MDQSEQMATDATIHERVAHTLKRDAEGHFLKGEVGGVDFQGAAQGIGAAPKAPQQYSPYFSQSPQPHRSLASVFTSAFVPNPIGPRFSKTTDDNTLIDVHVGNPLRKIAALLEEIKRQKAFSFTLKGSLGVMGVFLTLSVFGIFGGGKILCDKGTQTEAGQLKVLAITEEQPRSGPEWLNGWTDMWDAYVLHKPQPMVMMHRVVLMSGGGSWGSASSFGAEAPIKLMTKSTELRKQLDLETLDNQLVYVTGTYDSCARTLTVEEAIGLEVVGRE